MSLPPTETLTPNIVATNKLVEFLTKTATVIKEGRASDILLKSVMELYLLSKFDADGNTDLQHQDQDALNEIMNINDNDNTELNLNDQELVYRDTLRFYALGWYIYSNILDEDP